MIRSGSLVTLGFLGVIAGAGVLGMAPGVVHPLHGALPVRGAESSQVTGAAAAYRRIPLYFEANRGQGPAAAAFLAQGPGYQLALTPDGPLLALKRAGGTGAVVRVRMQGARRGITPLGRDRQPGTVNYLHGRDPRAWRRGIPVYARVRYPRLYPGIDLVFHGREDRLEYDFRLAPGAAVDCIRMAFGRAAKLRVDGAGRLHVRTAAGEIIQQAPQAYQRIDGGTRPVASRYVMTAAHEVGFAVGDYDRHRPLVIDPVLSFAAFIGGSGDDQGTAIAYHGGSIFITGKTSSADFSRAFNSSTSLNNSVRQVTPGVVDLGSPITLTTAAPAGSQARSTLTAKTPSGDFQLKVDLSGLNQAEKNTGLELQVGGATYSFSVQSHSGTQTAVATSSGASSACRASETIAGSGAFEDTDRLLVSRVGQTLTFARQPSSSVPAVPVVNCSGAPPDSAALTFYTETLAAGAKTSVFAGLSLNAFVITGQQAVVAGAQPLTGDFQLRVSLSDLSGPVAPSGLNAAVKKAGVRLQIGAATYEFVAESGDGANQDYCAWDISGVADPDAAACSSGGASISHPIAARGSDFEEAGQLVISRTGSTLKFETYSLKTALLNTHETVGTLPGVSTAAASLSLISDSLNGTAETTGFSDYFVTDSGAAPDTFVVRLDNGGTTFAYATYLGGSAQDEGRAIAVDGSDQVYVAGQTFSADFPGLNGAYTGCMDLDGDKQCDNGGDGFVAKLDSSGSLSAATYLGGCFDDAINGIALDSADNAYVVGYTESGPDSATSSGNGCSSEFPVVNTNSLFTAYHGRKDAFVAKFTPALDSLVYSGFLGGGYADEALGVAVSPTGEAYVTGYTASSDFPLSTNAAQTAMGATTSYDAFVTELNGTGDGILYSTYLGGEAYDYGSRIALSLNGGGTAVTGVYVTGWTRSERFPVTSDALQSFNAGSYDAFLARFDPAGGLAYATYLGGTDDDAGADITVQADTNGGDAVAITGHSESPDFLVSLLRDLHQGDAVEGALNELQEVPLEASSDPDPNDPNESSETYDISDCVAETENGTDAPADPLTAQAILSNYVMNNLPICTLIKAWQDLTPPGTAVPQVDPENVPTRSVVIGGITDFMHQRLESELKSVQTDLGGSSDAIVLKLDFPTSGSPSMTYATYLGGGDDDGGAGIALDDSGQAYVTGYTVTNDNISGLSQAPNFPSTVSAGQWKVAGAPGARENDVFVAKIANGESDLSLSLSADPSGAVADGAAITFTLTATNNGTAAANGVVVTDVLPIDLNLVSASAAQGSCAPAQADITKFIRPITCSLGTLAAGASTQITIKTIAGAQGAPVRDPVTGQFGPATQKASVKSWSSTATPTSTAVASMATTINPSPPLQSERTCNISSTKEYGCAPPKLAGAMDAWTLATLAAFTLLLPRLRRRR